MTIESELTRLQDLHRQATEMRQGWQQGLQQVQEFERQNIQQQEVAESIKKEITQPRKRQTQFEVYDKRGKKQKIDITRTPVPGLLRGIKERQRVFLTREYPAATAGLKEDAKVIKEEKEGLTTAIGEINKDIGDIEKAIQELQKAKEQADIETWLTGKSQEERQIDTYFEYLKAAQEYMKEYKKINPNVEFKFKPLTGDLLEDLKIKNPSLPGAENKFLKLVDYSLLEEKYQRQFYPKTPSLLISEKSYRAPSGARVTIQEYSPEKLLDFPSSQVKMSSYKMTSKLLPQFQQRQFQVNTSKNLKIQSPKTRINTQKLNEKIVLTQRQRKRSPFQSFFQTRISKKQEKTKRPKQIQINRRRIRSSSLASKLFRRK